jgi:putative ABC transport system permease protein
MIAASIFGIAINALLANKLRSSLTLLGVIFGVTSVMTIISALEGMMDSLEETFARLGPSTFMVGKMMTAMSNEEFREKRKRKPIEMDAYDMVLESCELCDKVSPRTFVFTKVKRGSAEMERIPILGTKANYIDIVDIELEFGRFHSFEDDLYNRRVAMIGWDLREELFPGVDPIGRDFKIGAKKYTVIGVGKKRGSMFGQSQDRYVVVPLSVHLGQFGLRQRGLQLTVKAQSVEQLEEAMDEVRLILRSQRNVPYNEPDDFDIMTADSLLELLNQFTKMFRMVLVGISSISLVVGGIVVMNIMMVSVTERTREIGIRKSLGARRGHILLQFLYESLLLTLSGGLVGIVLGFIIARSLVAWIDMQISPSIVAIMAGLFISTGTGLVFGIYPAMKAARLDPVKALSYE